MKKIILAASLSVFLFSACNSNNSNDQPDTMKQAKEENENKNLPDDDSKFVTKAAEGGMMEVEMSKMASEKAITPDVKNFARQMAEDHGKVNAELKALAQTKNISIPEETTKDTKDALESLSKKNGIVFDKEYMDKMVSDHKNDIDLFEKGAKDTKDQDLRGFASKTLPTLRMHLEMAEKTYENVKNRKR